MPYSLRNLKHDVARVGPNFDGPPDLEFRLVGGSGRMKLDDEIVEVGAWDAVRVPPGTWRGYEAGPEGLELVVIGAPILGGNRRRDVTGRRDWWTG